MTLRCSWLAATLLLASATISTFAIHYAEFTDDSNSEFWIKSGQHNLQKVLAQEHITNQAKNIILFVGDGMGIPSITASRIYKGQKAEQRGEESSLVFERFPHVALIKTYNVDRQVPDSAATATAIFSGVKTIYETLGMSPAVERNNCQQSKKCHVDTLLTWAQKSGRSTGIVTTTRITHATPAALYSHAARRHWECDACKPANASDCKDIAKQLIEDEPGNKVNVILGGGLRNFVSVGEGGKRVDGADLIGTWKRRGNDTRRTYVTTAAEFRAVDPEDTDYLLGLFSMDHMDYELDRKKKDPSSQPSLKEMTAQTIRILMKNPRGFFLVVEGGRIDHAHHDNQAKRAFEDTIAFDNAIQQAMDMTSKKDTLIVVTADHSHVMTINGYPERGTNILGVGDVSDVDNMAYTTIMYTNGPGGHRNVTANVHRSKLNQTDTGDDDYVQLALVPALSETHGGEDVAVYAQGPYAHLFQGVHEQSYIAHVVNYASCMGPKEFLKKCDALGASLASGQQTSSLSYVLTLPLVLFFSLY